MVRERTSRGSQKQHDRKCEAGLRGRSAAEGLDLLAAEAAVGEGRGRVQGPGLAMAPRSGPGCEQWEGGDPAVMGGRECSGKRAPARFESQVYHLLVRELE